MADDDDFETLPDKLVEKLSGVIKEQAERLSAEQLRALQSLEQSPDETGHLEDSLRVEPGENDLEYVVMAGGSLTTSEIREGASDVPYDYAEGFEFGNSHQPARPFFWNTYRAMKDDIQNEIEKAIEEVLNDE